MERQDGIPRGAVRVCLVRARANPRLRFAHAQSCATASGHSEWIDQPSILDPKCQLCNETVNDFADDSSAVAFVLRRGTREKDRIFRLCHSACIFKIARYDATQNSEPTEHGTPAPCAHMTAEAYATSLRAIGDVEIHTWPDSGHMDWLPVNCIIQTSDRDVVKRVELDLRKVQWMQDEFAIVGYTDGQFTQLKADLAPFGFGIHVEQCTTRSGAPAFCACVRSVNPDVTKRIRECASKLALIMSPAIAIARGTIAIGAVIDPHTQHIILPPAWLSLHRCNLSRFGTRVAESGRIEVGPRDTAI